MNLLFKYQFNIKINCLREKILGVHFNLVRFLKISEASVASYQLCLQVLQEKIDSFVPGCEDHEIIDLFVTVTKLDLDEMIASVMTLLVYLDNLQIKFGIAEVRNKYRRIFDQYRSLKYQFDPIPYGRKSDHWVVTWDVCSRCFMDLSETQDVAQPQCPLWNRKMCTFCRTMSYCRCGYDWILDRIRDSSN